MTHGRIMNEFIEIQWTTGSIDEARRVCRYLVQERLIACAQIFPWIESIYMWNNQLETVQETKVILKTSLSKFEKVKEAIIQNCSYELPEVTYLKIDGGNTEYLNWLAESTPDITTSVAKQ